MTTEEYDMDLDFEPEFEQTSNEEIRAWAEKHVALGHDAGVAFISAPGYGRSAYCQTCDESGPRNGGILTAADVI
jgi:hypothetical protein